MDAPDAAPGAAMDAAMDAMTMMMVKRSERHLTAWGQKPFGT